jgi:hypothetical protein
MFFLNDAYYNHSDNFKRGLIHAMLSNGPLKTIPDVLILIEEKRIIENDKAR